MVHWGFLMLAFVLGIGACYGVLYWTAREAGGLLEWLYRR